MAPDLPVVLWCHSERLSRDEAFQKLFPLTDKLIVDSSVFADPPAALNFIRRLNAAGRNVADLTWTRLTRLRGTIAQIFENECTRAHLKEIERVTIAYSGPAAADPETMPACLQYLIAWFGATLPVSVEAIYKDMQPAYQIRGIDMQGPRFGVSLELEDGAAVVHVNQLTRRIAFPKQSDCDLLREELSIVGVDPIYRRCLG